MKNRNDVMLSSMKRSMAQHTKKDKKLLLYHPAIAVGTTSKHIGLWKGQYINENSFNDVTFRVTGENNSKEQIVHYDKLKPFFEPPPTSNVPTRNKPRNFHSTQHIADTHKNIDGTVNHDDCLSLLPTPLCCFYANWKRDYNSTHK